MMTYFPSYHFRALFYYLRPFSCFRDSRRKWTQTVWVIKCDNRQNPILSANLIRWFVKGSLGTKAGLWISEVGRNDGRNIHKGFPNTIPRMFYGALCQHGGARYFTHSSGSESSLQEEDLLQQVTTGKYLGLGQKLLKRRRRLFSSGLFTVFTARVWCRDTPFFGLLKSDD